MGRAGGPARVERPYYLCSRCHRGQFPADVDLDIVDTESSPGVRRMQALVGQDAPFDRGREQMKRLAGLEVTAKAVERTAEAIGVDIAKDGGRIAHGHAASFLSNRGGNRWVCHQDGEQGQR